MQTREACVFRSLHARSGGMRSRQTQPALNPLKEEDAQQVTLLDRPLPPGEGRGEGLCHSKSKVNHHQSKTNPQDDTNFEAVGRRQKWAFRRDATSAFCLLPSAF